MDINTNFDTNHLPGKNLHSHTDRHAYGHAHPYVNSDPDGNCYTDPDLHGGTFKHTNCHPNIDAVTHANAIGHINRDAYANPINHNDGSQYRGIPNLTAQLDAHAG